MIQVMDFIFGAPPPASRLPPLVSLAHFAGIFTGLLLLLALQRPSAQPGCWLPPASSKKRAYEAWVLRYSVVWMGVFAVVIALQLYEHLDAMGYFVLCGGLALPLALQPLVAPFEGDGGKKDKKKAAAARLGASHAARAQCWVAVFGFIGNYWYTHYFYCVLRARYTMPAWRLNDVPIAMFLATHFYFTSYHVLANLPLRYVRTAFAPGHARTALQAALVLAMSYATAFMETLTISNFPYYDFEDRHLAYTVGSAFYGLYFVVSFPMYFAIDEPGGGGLAGLGAIGGGGGAGVGEAAVSALAAGMLVLLLLDFVRLAVVGAELRVGGLLYEVTG